MSQTPLFFIVPLAVAPTPFPATGRCFRTWFLITSQFSLSFLHSPASISVLLPSISRKLVWVTLHPIWMGSHCLLRNTLFFFICSALECWMQPHLQFHSATYNAYLKPNGLLKRKKRQVRGGRLLLLTEVMKSDRFTSITLGMPHPWSPRLRYGAKHAHFALLNLVSNQTTLSFDLLLVLLLPRSLMKAVHLACCRR